MVASITKPTPFVLAVADSTSVTYTMGHSHYVVSKGNQH